MFLKAWRQHTGMTQQELADRLGTSKSIISELESGHQRWNRDHLAEIGFALGIEPEDLLRRPETSPDLQLIWQRIPESQRAHALAILETYAKTSVNAA